MLLCRCFCLAIVASLLSAGLNSASAQTRRWVAPQGVVSVLKNGGNYTTYLGQSFFDYAKGGKGLGSALAPLYAKAVPDYRYRAVTRTNVPDGVYNECVAFGRGCTGAPPTRDWRRGQQVLFCAASGGITPGTMIATFTANRAAPGGYSYSGHTALFAGYTSGGVAVWDQNWLEDRTILSHSLSASYRGGVSDAAAYYVVETGN